MAESESPSTEVLVSGGFRIEISLNEIAVTGAKGNKKYIPILLAAVFIGYLLNRSSPFWILVIIAMAGLQYWFRGVHNMRCTRETLEVTDVSPGRANRIKSYARTDVKEVRFGEVAVSKYGGTGGLIFQVADKQIKTLYGLKPIEAQRILNELQRLGFDVYQDPGMPMMVDMEKSRRKTKFFS
jgi:hypothetical protein